MSLPEGLIYLDLILPLGKADSYFLFNPFTVAAYFGNHFLQPALLKGAVGYALRKVVLWVFGYKRCIGVRS